MARLDLGLGMVISPGLLDVVDHLGDRIECFEVEPQTMWLPTGDPTMPWRPDVAAYDALAERGKPMLAHGVSAPVGTSQPPHGPTVDLFAASAARLGARHASEHLSFNAAGHGLRRIDTGLFLPPCPTDAGVARAVTGAAAHQRALGGSDLSFAVETGVNYLRPLPGELPDSEVVARVAKAANCGILLDLHNLWCNERNGRERVADAVARLPLERVTEVHLAGGVELDGYWLDGHCDLVPPALLAIAEDVLALLPHVRVVTFELLALHVGLLGLDRVRCHLDELAAMVDRARKAPVRRPPRHPGRIDACLDVTPEAWEAGLAAAATGWRVDPAVAPIVDPAAPLLRRLVDAGRAGRIVRGAPGTFELLRSRLDRRQLDGVIAAFTTARPPALWGADEAGRFLTWLVDSGADVPGLDAAVADDLTALDEAVDVVS